MVARRARAIPHPLPSLPQKPCLASLDPDLVSGSHPVRPVHPAVPIPAVSTRPRVRVCRYVCFQSLAGHTDAVLSVVTDGIKVISGSRDGTIKVRFGFCVLVIVVVPAWFLHVCCVFCAGISFYLYIYIGGLAR